jgi:hypothetical protein
LNNLSEDEILDYLMTSDFDDGLSPEQFKFLLLKFRNFYRLIACSVNLTKERMEQSKIEKEEKVKECDLKIEQVNCEKSELINKVNAILNKKLTWKERILGKIIEGHENN